MAELRRSGRGTYLPPSRGGRHGALLLSLRNEVARAEQTLLEGAGARWGMASPRDPRGRRDHGKPELLLGKNIAPIYRAQTARPTSSRFTKYNADLPDRYLSQMTPFSTPLCDARVHVARAKSHFKRKLHHLVQIFVRVDKNQNGLIPRTEVRWCSMLTCTPRRAAATPYARARAPISCTRRAHGAQGRAHRGGTLCTGRACANVPMPRPANVLIFPMPL